MIAASSLAFPGSKTLSAWWSQLSSCSPQQLWVGHLFIHRLEILADVVQPAPLDGLQSVLLRVFALEESAGTAQDSMLDRLDSHLHLGQAVISRLLADLRTEGLLVPDRLALTEPGRLAAAQGNYPRRSWQRRELVFVERLLPDGTRALPPHFLALGAAPQRWQPDANAVFDLAWVKACSAQPQEWKENFAFPQEVHGIADPLDAQPELPPHWQRVPIDRPERLLAALVAAGQQGGEKILIFAAQQEGWELRSKGPIGVLPWTCRQEFPDLAEPSSWQKAWQEWCLARQFTAADAQACTLTRSAHRLLVEAPAPLHARLAAGKSDLLRGDTWLLAGDNYLRCAANVALSPAIQIKGS